MIWTDLHQRMRSRTARVLALCGSLAFFTACGFDWDSDDGGNDDGTPGSGGPGAGDLPEGNDGGSSIALLTSKDGIVGDDFEISYETTLNVPSNATVSIDNATASVDDLQDGMILRMKYDSDSNERPNEEPTVTEVSVTHMLIGPITSQNPLRVMGREVIVTEDTFLPGTFNQRNDNDIQRGVAALALNSTVKISGYLNSNNTILATRVEPSSVDQWQMVGTVERVTDINTLEMGGVTVNFADITAPEACNNNQINPNDLVVIQATPSAEFIESEGLRSIDSIRCSNHLQLPELFPEDNEVTTSLPAEIEGFVTSFSGGSEFFINQQPVSFDTLAFSGGREDDFRVGALVEVEGSFDLFTRTLIATTVKFHQRRIYVRAPVNRDNLDSETNTFSVLGIPFDLTGLRIPSNNPVGEAIASGSITEDNQAEIYGFVDQENNPYLVGIEDGGRANFEAFELMGPIDDESRGQPDILQVRIDLDSDNGMTTYLQDSLWIVRDAERQISSGSDNASVFTLQTNDNDTTETTINSISTTRFFTEDSFNRQTRN